MPLRFEKGAACRVPGISPTKRRLVLRAADGKLFVGKNDHCVKAAGTRNPARLVNELVYAEYARAAGLRVPELRLLLNQGREYLGSELLPGRRPLKRSELRAFLPIPTNLPQLTRALLLDLALLNSDRTHGNMLRDARGLLWFIDHDKALWGDGREEEDQPSGDLYRLDLSSLDRKVADYLNDFLSFEEATHLVFVQKHIELIREEFGRLPLTLAPLECARKATPGSWVNDDLFRRLGAFLPRWWGRLREVVQSENVIGALRS